MWGGEGERERKEKRKEREKCERGCTATFHGKHSLPLPLPPSSRVRQPRSFPHDGVRFSRPRSVLSRNTVSSSFSRLSLSLVALLLTHFGISAIVLQGVLGIGAKCGLAGNVARLPYDQVGDEIGTVWTGGLKSLWAALRREVGV